MPAGTTTIYGPDGASLEIDNGDLDAYLSRGYTTTPHNPTWPTSQGPGGTQPTKPTMTALPRMTAADDLITVYGPNGDSVVIHAIDAPTYERLGYMQRVEPGVGQTTGGTLTGDNRGTQTPLSDADWFTANAPKGATGGSWADQRTQADRIAAGDSPAGSTMYRGQSGRIDLRSGLDPNGIRSQLQGMARAAADKYGYAADIYDESDLEGFLRNTGYDNGKSSDEMLAFFRQNYEDRARSGNEHADMGGPGSGGTSTGGQTGGTLSGDYRWLPSGNGADQGQSGGAYAPSTYAPMSSYGSSAASPTAMPGDQYASLVDTIKPPADLMDAWTRQFVAPDPTQIAADPVVQARLALGLEAREKSAAARGTLLTPGVTRGLDEYAQQVATEEYAKMYDRAMQEYDTAYGVFTGDRTRRQSAFNDQFGQAYNDRGQRASIAQSERQLGQTDRTLGQADYRLVQGDRSLGQTDRSLGQGDYRLRQDDYRLGQTDRQLTESERMNTFGMGRTNRMDDFSIYDSEISRYYDNLWKGVQYGRPV